MAWSPQSLELIATKNVLVVYMSTKSPARVIDSTFECMFCDFLANEKRFLLNIVTKAITFTKHRRK